MIPITSMSKNFILMLLSLPSFPPPDIVAHKDASPSPYTAEAPAGSDVAFHWHHEGNCGSDEEGWDCSHHGWTATYLASCNGDCKNFDKPLLFSSSSRPDWLLGYRSIFCVNGNSQSVVSIHDNGNVSNRQFWPQAFNIKVTGGDDSAQVPARKKGTELYKASDDLLQWDLYWHTAGETIEDAPDPQLPAVASIQKRAHARDFSA
ncbi:Glyco-hydro-61 multi-domain protein [Pyrenophora tritici-repentis]|nr:Glyco-hydro-61 multi-domain protein [Pyrenophora tritici-repentis]